MENNALLPVKTLTPFGLLLRSRMRTVLEKPDGFSEPIILKCPSFFNYCSLDIPLTLCYALMR